ncbi:MAG: GIY-YIG nuclease family protein [Bacteroidetes bacterium]|nr:GIY-YIG nuclease family protein [Bacteroidota bacterium]
MYTVYVIKSTEKDWFYVGQSSNFERRLEHHNRGYNRSTKPYRPFELVLTEEYDTREQARSREKELKSTMGKRFIRKYYSNKREEKK